MTLWPGRVAVAALPALVPAAALWVWRREQAVLISGTPLTPAQLADARALSVQHPERVRLQAVRTIQTFEHSLLAPLAWATRAAFAHTIGLTLHHAILIRREWWDHRVLVAHELAHVAQYERLGGIRPFLHAYFRECLECGYPFAPLEREATSEAARIIAT